ncbi:MAG: right-handed parallel beta-helix repeat-containing protein [Verrucomicrobiota bacterium]|jgi:parallel beta-helix repeat protein
MLKCKYSSLAATIVLAGSLMAQADIIDTIQNAKSGATVNVSGTYSVTRQCLIPAGVTVTGPATFNFNNAGNGMVPNGNNVRLNQISVTGVNHPGIYIYNRSGCVINSCNAYGNADTGIMIQGSGSANNTIQYCQAYNNVDTATDGQNADGFGCKFSSSSGNKFVNCISEGNADDGFDLWEAGAAVTFTSCQAYSNGKLSEGNGNGFKMGSSGMNLAHSLTSCIAHNNSGTTGCGFTQNGNVGNCHLTTCHSYSNKHADVLTNCSLSNCTMQN